MGPGTGVVSADGGVFTDGSAGFFGSLGGVALAAPPVAISPTPSGLGYWLVAADWGVFSFGDAPFLGSLGNLSLAAPIVDLAVTPSGERYWLAGADGGVFAFGDAMYLGSASSGEDGDVVAIAAARDGSGYRLVVGDADVRFGSLAEQSDKYFLRSWPGRPVDVVALDGPRILVLTDDGRVTIRGSGRIDNQRRIDEARAALATASVPNYALVARGNWGFFCLGTSLSFVVEGAMVDHSIDGADLCEIEGYTIESLHDWSSPIDAAHNSVVAGHAVGLVWPRAKIAAQRPRASCRLGHGGRAASCSARTAAHAATHAADEAVDGSPRWPSAVPRRTARASTGGFRHRIPGAGTGAIVIAATSASVRV